MVYEEEAVPVEEEPSPEGEPLSEDAAPSPREEQPVRKPVQKSQEVPKKGTSEADDDFEIFDL